MKAIDRIIETILPDFLSFIQEQESLKNSNKELDNKLFPSINDYDKTKGVYNANGN